MIHGHDYEYGLVCVHACMHACMHVSGEDSKSTRVGVACVSERAYYPHAHLWPQQSSIPSRNSDLSGNPEMSDCQPIQIRPPYNSLSLLMNQNISVYLAGVTSAVAMCTVPSVIQTALLTCFEYAKHHTGDDK